MNHEDIKKLLSAYVEGELDASDKKAVAAHLDSCSRCQAELAELNQLEEVLNKMKLKSPPEETWEIYWGSVYNRLERKIGWIVFSIGLMLLIFFGAFQAIKDIILNPETPLLLVIGLLVSLAGGIILFVSVLKEQVFCRKRERYKEIKK